MKTNTLHIGTTGLTDSLVDGLIEALLLRFAALLDWEIVRFVNGAELLADGLDKGRIVAFTQKLLVLRAKAYGFHSPPKAF